MAYDPTVWRTGDVVSSYKLNKLENGLAGSYDEIARLDGDIDGLADDLDTEVAALRSQIGSPLVANTAEEMTNINKVYVYTGSETGYTAGHWYYFDGTAWTDGGVYNAVAVQTDKTLTVSDMPADAKVTGDEIAGLKEDLSYVYQNIENKDEVTSLVFTSGGISETNGQIQTNVSRIRLTIASMPIMYGGDVVDIDGVFEARVYANSTAGYTDNNIISGSSWISGKFEISDEYDGKYIGILIRVKDHTTDDISSYVSTVGDYVKYYHVEKIKDVVNELNASAVRITSQTLTGEEKLIARTNIGAVSGADVYSFQAVTDWLRQNYKFWDVSSGTVATLNDISSGAWVACTQIPVSEGDFFKIQSVQGASHKVRIWTIVDDDFNIIAKADDYYTTPNTLINDEFVVPENGTLLLCTVYSANGKASELELFKRTITTSRSLKGKKLSLLGDSISAYTGTIPGGYDAYYTGSNSGVDNPKQMWWSVLCDRLGMVPLVINGYSGSAVTQLEDSAHVSKIPMSSDERCSGLDDGTNNPDIIIIAGGVNDYTYAQSAQSEPLEWDGLTAPTLGDSFTEAYACMIKKLQTNYPNAIVVALSTWFTMRGDDNGYTLTHTVGNNKYTQQNYNDKIRYVAEQMHIPYIDVSNIGFNRNNFYPTYASDSSTIPTHPNANGQRVMGEAIARKLPELVKGYLN